MLQTGTLRANESTLFCEDDLLFAYDFMSQQMKKRIGAPAQGIKYPVWAWYQWEGVRKRPDMRSHGQMSPKGTPIVLLTVDVPDELVLLSDFDMWHCVLNEVPCPLSKEDDKDDPTPSEVIASWENIFQWDVVTDYWKIPKSTQATMWEIRKEWVKKAEFFLSR